MHIYDLLFSTSLTYVTCVSTSLLGRSIGLPNILEQLNLTYPSYECKF